MPDNLKIGINDDRPVNITNSKSNQLHGQEHSPQAERAEALSTYLQT